MTTSIITEKENEKVNGSSSISEEEKKLKKLKKKEKKEKKTTDSMGIEKVKKKEKKEKKDKKDKKDKKEKKEKKEKKDKKEKKRKEREEEEESNTSSDTKVVKKSKKDKKNSSSSSSAESTTSKNHNDNNNNNSISTITDISIPKSISLKQTNQEWHYSCDYQNKIVSSTEVAKYMESNDITITAPSSSMTKPPRPLLEFNHASFPTEITSILSSFQRPTPIQAASWPPLLSGNDVIGIAATGSGKTLAFAIPGVIHVWNKRVRGEVPLTTKNKKKNGFGDGVAKPSVLIVSPTRELAIQSQETSEQVGNAFGIQSKVVYGGVPKYEQKKLIREGCDILVATPGRLLDLLEDDDPCMTLASVSYLVLDEADRMLDCGFEEDMKRIVSKIPREKRQTVMFSATWPTSIQTIASTHLSNPIHITVGSMDLSANNRIEQIIEVLDPMAKEKRLLELLRQYHKSRKNRVLIFALYKKEADRLENTLRRNGFKVIGIHGDKSQMARNEALKNFKDGSFPLMVATDVAVSFFSYFSSYYLYFFLWVTVFILD